MGFSESHVLKVKSQVVSCVLKFLLFDECSRCILGFYSSYIYRVQSP